MFNVLYIHDKMESLMNKIMTVVPIVIVLAIGRNLEIFSTLLSIGVLSLAGFFWLIKNKREIQEYHGNSICRAIKSIFRKYNKYKSGREKD